MLCKVLNTNLFKILFFFLINIITLTVPNLIFAHIEITKLAIEKNYLVISLSSDSTNHVNMGRIIDDGINLKVIYHFTILKKSNLLSGVSTVSNLTIVLHNKRDIINNGYESEIYFNDETRGRWFPNIQELLNSLLVIQNLKLINLDSLNNDEIYFIEVWQEIISLELYPPLNIIYSLVNTWNYTSDKIKSIYFDKNGIINE